MIFRKKPVQRKTYNPEVQKPVIRVSICTGEKVAGFKRLDTGHFEEVMLIRDGSDEEEFKATYGITEEISVIY